MSTQGIVPSLKDLLQFRYYAKGLSLFNQQKLDSIHNGNRLSVSRGRGMDFEEVRRYQAGDDVRLIHWPLTARLGKAYTKIYREERERSVYFVLDQSESMKFGTKVCFKSVMAANAFAMLGWAALQNHEQVGGVVFTDTGGEFVTPKRSLKSLLNLFSFITAPLKIKSGNAGLTNSLQRVLKKIKSGSIVIVISDYLHLSKDDEVYLKLISQKAQLINVFIYDPLEVKLPDFGNYSFTGDGKIQLEISANKRNKITYSKNFMDRLNQIKHLSKKNNMQFIQLATNDDLLNKINHGIMNYGCY